MADDGVLVVVWSTSLVLCCYFARGWNPQRPPDIYCRLVVAPPIQPMFDIDRTKRNTDDTRHQLSTTQSVWIVAVGRVCFVFLRVVQFCGILFLLLFLSATATVMPPSFSVLDCRYFRRRRRLLV